MNAHRSTVWEVVADARVVIWDDRAGFFFARAIRELHAQVLQSALQCHGGAKKRVVVVKPASREPCLKALNIVREREQAIGDLPALILGQLDAARADYRWRWQKLLFGGRGAQERLEIALAGRLFRRRCGVDRLLKSPSRSCDCGALQGTLSASRSP